MLLPALVLAFSAHVPNRNSSDIAKLLVADKAGNLFIVYSPPKTSAVTNIHVIKTDPLENATASFDFGGTGIDSPSAAAVDPQGNLIVVGTEVVERIV